MGKCEADTPDSDPTSTSMTDPQLSQHTDSALTTKKTSKTTPHRTPRQRFPTRYPEKHTTPCQQSITKYFVRQHQSIKQSAKSMWVAPADLPSSEDESESSWEAPVFIPPDDEEPQWAASAIIPITPYLTILSRPSTPPSSNHPHVITPLTHINVPHNTHPRLTPFFLPPLPVPLEQTFIENTPK